MTAQFPAVTSREGNDVTGRVRDVTSRLRQSLQNPLPTRVILLITSDKLWIDRLDEMTRFNSICFDGSNELTEVNRVSCVN